MVTTPPRRRNPEAGPQTPKSNRKRQTGQWSDGVWWCNCDPPRKATLREVKKNSPNKGKFFWSCTAYPYCRFFLWREQAMARETGPASSQPVPGPSQPKTPTYAQRTLTSFGYPLTQRQRVAEPDAAAADETDSDDSTIDEEMSQEARRAIMEPLRPEQYEASVSPSASAKRKQDALDDGFFDDLDSEEEKELTVISETKPSTKSIHNPSQRRADPYTTPLTSRAVDMGAGLPTPSVARTLFPDTANKRQKNVSFEEAAEGNTITSAAMTPTSSRNQPLPSSSPAEATCDVTQDVMDLLRDQNVAASVLTSIRDLLETSARKSRGIARGRDSAREALREKAEKIARLQDRVAALENKEKMLNSQLTNTKADLMRMYNGI